MVNKFLKIALWDGEKNESEITLPEKIFGVTASDKLLAQYVRVYLNNLKPGTALTKTRHFVIGSTRKIYKQKGTGRARHGDIKAPIFVGGGTAHGPINLKRPLFLPKKMRRKALFYSLSLKAKEKKIWVLANSYVNKISKTEDAVGMLKKVFSDKKDKRKGVFILPHNDNSKKYFRNIEDLDIKEGCDLNAYLVLKNQKLIFTESSIKELEKIFIK